MATGITAGEIMRKHVITARPTDTLQKIMQVMTRADIGSVVVKTGGRVAGIITEGDIIRALARGKTIKTKAREIMTSPVRMIRADVDLEKVGELMRDLNISRIPVVDKRRRLVGIITERDMVRVEPALIEFMVEKGSLEKLAPHEGIGVSGHCENCKNYSDNLRFVEFRYLCEDCRR